MTAVSQLRTGFALAAVCAALLGIPASAAQLKLNPLTWPNDTQLQYGIYDGKGERTATAYYRILKEKVNNKTLYHFKYLGRNEKMSESSEVWIDPDTQLPVRSTRKLAGRKTFYVDCAYQPGMITVRQKYEGQAVTELKVPATGGFFDYEQLIWLVPQIDWSGDDMTYVNYFNTFKFQLQTAVVTRDGQEQITVKDKAYPAVRYRFDVGSTHYVLWTVDQSGRAVPARIFMDESDDRRDVSFINLGLDRKKVKDSAVSGIKPASPLPGAGGAGFQPIPLPPGSPAPPPAPGQSPPQTKPPAPAPDPPPGEDPPEDENPLVPRGPGGRFP